MNPVSLQPADAAVVPFINNLTHANQPVWAMVMIKLATEYTEAVFEFSAQHNTPFHPYAFPPRMHRKVLSDRNMPWDAAWDPAPAVAHVPAVPAFAGDAAANPPIPAVPAVAAIPAQPARPDGPILATTFPGLQSIVPADGSEPTKWAQTVYAANLATHKALHAINAELKRKLLASTASLPLHHRGSHRRHGGGGRGHEPHLVQCPLHLSHQFRLTQGLIALPYQEGRQLSASQRGREGVG